MRLIISLLLTVIALGVSSQVEWVLEKDEEGIKVYTRKPEGSSFKEYKAEAIMHGTLDDFKGIIMNVEDYPDVYSNVETARLLEASDTTLIYYMTTDVPWPVKDRDAIIAVSIRRNTKQDLLEIFVNALPGYLEEKRGYVRIRKTQGKWNVKHLKDDTLQVHLRMHAEPSGSIPSWLANRYIVDGPYEDFSNIREILK